MTSTINTQPVVEQIEEMKSKLKLLDGDTKAYYEISFRYLQDAKERIHSLRNEVRQLRNDYVEIEDTSEFIMDQAFQKNKDNVVKMSNKPTTRVMVEMDYEVSNRLNLLNSLRHQTKLKLKKIEQVETNINDTVDRMESTKVFTSMEQGVIQGIRNLENKLDKAAMKSDETVHIGKTYEAIKVKMLEERTTYATTVEALETEIRRNSLKLLELKSVSDDAQDLRDKAKDEFKRHEEVAYAYRKRRELEMVNMRRTLETCKQQEIAPKTLMLDDDIGKTDPEVSLGDRSERSAVMDDASMLARLEAIHLSLKEVIGVASLELMEARFSQLINSTERLETLRTQNELRLIAVNEQKIKLKAAFLEIRAVADSRLSEESTIKEASKVTQHLNETLTMSVNEYLMLKDRLSQARMIAEQLYMKLVQVKVSHKHSKKQSKFTMKHMSEMVITDILEQCMEMLDQLVQDLDEYNIDMKLDDMFTYNQNIIMFEDEYQASIKNKIPLNNQRVFPGWLDNSSTILVEEEDPDDPDFKTRNEMKNHATYMVSVHKKQQKKG